MENKCKHDWITYKSCCYCGAFDNGKEVIEKRVNSSIEYLREEFSKWYFGFQQDTGKPPLAMQIFYWFENNALV